MHTDRRSNWRKRNRTIAGASELNDLTEGWETLQKGHQTPQLVRTKKIDAVCRSLPSTTIQLYGLLLSLNSINRSNYFTLLASVLASVVGAAMTLANLSPKSGSTMFSSYFVIHFFYYAFEMTVRVLLVVFYFVSVGAAGCAPFGFEFLMRSFLSSGFDGKMFISGLMFLGSNGIDGVNNKWAFGMSVTTVLLFIFLLVVNTLQTPTLDSLRVTGVLTGLYVLACSAWFLMCALALFIYNMTVIEEAIPEKLSTTSDVEMVNPEIDSAFRESFSP